MYLDREIPTARGTHPPSLKRRINRVNRDPVTRHKRRFFSSREIENIASVVEELDQGNFLF